MGKCILPIVSKKEAARRRRVERTAERLSKTAPDRWRKFCAKIAAAPLAEIGREWLSPEMAALKARVEIIEDRQRKLDEQQRRLAKVLRPQ